jgi:hypothetical protein
LSQDQTQTIALKGFLIKAVHLPSEHLVIRHFNDTEPIIDEIGKVLSELPPELTKRFTQVRTRVYQTLIPHYAICLQKLGIKSLWLVPLDKVLPLQQEFQEKYVKQLEELDRDIRRYLLGNDARKAKLREYLTSKGQSTEISIPKLAERASLDLTPFNIDFAYYRDFLNARERAGIETLNEKQKAALQKMEHDIAQERQRITESVILELQKRTSSIIEEITPELARSNPVHVANAITEIRSTAESLGIERSIVETLDTAQALVEAYSAPESERSARVADASDRLREHFELNASLSPQETLRQVARSLNKELNPRARALMTELEISESITSAGANDRARDKRIHNERGQALQNEIILAAAKPRRESA